MNRTRIQQAAALTAWLLGLVAVVALLYWLGNRTGTALPLQHPTTWRAWAVEKGTAVVVFSVIRLFAMASGIWLVLVTLAAVGLRTLGWTAAACRAEALTLPLARRLIAATMGISIAAPALGIIPPSLAAASIRPVAHATIASPLASAAQAGQSRSGQSRSGQSRSGQVQQTPQLVALGPQPRPSSARLEAQFVVGNLPTPTSPGSTSPVLSGLGTAVPSASLKSRPATIKAITTAKRTTQWTVRAGDDFWSIASTVLSSRLDRVPTEAEIESYTATLVSANTARLAHPSQPQLIFPGQVFLLPPTSFSSD